MADIYLNTNTTLRETYDKDGNLMKDYNPVFPYKSQFRVYWQLFTETPGADADGKDMSAWTKADYTGCGALLTCDSNYVHRMTAKLGAAITSGETITSITISDIPDVSLVPSAGYITLVNANAGIKEFYYSAVSISGTTAVCTIGEWEADANYAVNSAAKISEEPYFSAAYNASLSSPATGLFVFDCHVMSRKIAALADEASSRFIDTEGVELLPFKVSGNTYEELPSFLCDSATVSINMGEAGISPEISGSVENAILAEIQTLLAEGTSVELYNSTTEQWVPYASVAEITTIYTKYRWWLTAGGDDSAKVEIPLIWGEDGEAAGFGTPTASASTLAAGSTATATVTASGTDTEKVFSFEFGIPKGDQGEPGTFSDTSFLTFDSVSVSNLVTLTTACKPVSIRSGITGKYYMIEKGSVTLGTGSFTLDVTPYLVYDDAASFSGTWTVFMAAGLPGEQPQNMVPPGTVHAFAGAADAIPTGFLLCNGAAISRTDFGVLFASIGIIYGAGDGSTTFNLPDFRGKFLRGYLDGTSAALGTAQGDAIRNLYGTIDRFCSFQYGPFTFESGPLKFSSLDALNFGTGGSESRKGANLTFDASKAVPTASENRPVNYAVNYIIKY